MTPKILLPDDEGFRVYLYFRDHHPPHVHVYQSDASAAIALGDEDIGPYILDSSFKAKEERKAIRLVERYQAELLRAWREYA